jgi:hypothetical protein
MRLAGGGDDRSKATQDSGVGHAFRSRGSAARARRPVGDDACFLRRFSIQEAHPEASSCLAVFRFIVKFAGILQAGTRSADLRQLNVFYVLVG